MKKDIHPSNYREVVFKDMSNDEIFITRSTVASRETITVDGVEYPLVKLEITSASHPFFTGKQKLVDTAGRVDSGEMAVALALFPASMEQLMRIADTGNIMPPKTTWFEPKLRSGLVIHKLD